MHLWSIIEFSPNLGVLYLALARQHLRAGEPFDLLSLFSVLKKHSARDFRHLENEARGQFDKDFRHALDGKVILR